MSDIAYIDELLDASIDFKSPLASLVVLDKFRKSLTLLQGLLEDKSSLILEGTLDAIPPNQVSSYITDANPSAGAIDRDDKFNGITLQITSGSAQGEYVITDTDAGLDRIVVLENLGALGATTGDTYVLRGHSHNGFDSEIIEESDVIGLAGIQGLPVGTTAWFESASCPTGWTAAGGVDGNFYIGGPAITAGGTANHNHTIGTLGLGALPGTQLFRVPLVNYVAGNLAITNISSVTRGNHAHGQTGGGSFVANDMDLLGLGLKPCKVL